MRGPRNLFPIGWHWRSADTGGPGNLHAPLWTLALVGLLFLLAGLTIVLQGICKADAGGELPPDAPVWMRIVQRLMVLMIFAVFAMIGSWVALYGGADHFSGSFIGFATGIGIARIMFGIGAIIC